MNSNSCPLISTVANYLYEHTIHEGGKRLNCEVEAHHFRYDTPSSSFQLLLTSTHCLFFFFDEVQLENIYNEGTSVLSCYFACLGVSRHTPVMVWIFQPSLSHLFHIRKIRLSALEFLRRRKMPLYTCH